MYFFSPYLQPVYRSPVSCSFLTTYTTFFAGLVDLISSISGHFYVCILLLLCFFPTLLFFFVVCIISSRELYYHGLSCKARSSVGFGSASESLASVLFFPFY